MSIKEKCEKLDGVEEYRWADCREAPSCCMVLMGGIVSDVMDDVDGLAVEYRGWVLIIGFGL